MEQRLEDYEWNKEIAEILDGMTFDESTAKDVHSILK